MKLKFLFIVLFISACTSKGELDDDDKNKISFCKDLRDNSTFSFKTNNIKNVRIGYAGAPSSFDLLTEEGVEMHLNSDMQAYLKCESKREK